MSQQAPQVKEYPTYIPLTEVFAGIEDKRGVMFLNSSLQKGSGRYAVLGLEPLMVFQSKGKKITVKYANGRKYHFKGDVLKKLDYYFKKYKIEQKSCSDNPFKGGAMGYIAYEFGRQIEKLPGKTRDKLKIPDLYLAFYKNLLVEDKLNKKTYIVYSDQKICSTLSTLLANPKSTNKEVSSNDSLSDSEESIPWKSNFTKPQYLKALQKIKDYLKKGDVYQICLTQTLELPFKGTGEDLYLKLNEINPAPFGAYLNCDGFEVISSSPERFMQVNNGQIETCPIKGTAKRGKTPQEDEKLKNELFDSIKENAELTMIVDLERNDIGRICEFGTVKVIKHRELKAFPTVWHTISTIRGKLKKNISHAKVLRSVFPGGSITGAPKIRAMEILDELEPTTRGVYTGTIGYFGFDGYLDTSIVIRTILLKNGTAYLGVGGGIVMDSDIEAEYEETMIKAKAQLKAIEKARKDV